MPGDPTLREVDERAHFAPRPDVSFAPPTVVEPPAPGDAALVAREPTSLPHAGLLQTALRWTARSLPAALALEYDRGAIFLATPVFMAAGVFAYLALPQEPKLWSLAGLTALLASLAFAARDRNVLSVCLTLATAFCAGAALSRLEAVLADPKMLGAEISTVVTGRVVEANHLANGRVRLTLDVISTQRPKLRFAPDRVRVSAASVPASLKVGDTVTGAARLFPPSGPLRPGSYDFSFEAYFDGIGANGFFFQPPQRAVSTEPASLLQRWRDAVANFRNLAASRIESAVTGKAEGEIVAALIVGTRAGIPEDVNESLRRTGLAHILSISGLHMALVAVSVMGLFRFGFAAFPGFASRYPVKKAAALAAMLAITAYLVVSGAEVAARRSYIMLAVMLAAVMFDRAALTMRNLAIAAAITLAISPHEVVGPSFQMSFAATAALIGGFQIWTDYRRRRPRSWRPNTRHPVLEALRWSAAFIVGIAVTSILAGLATTIYGVWHFQRVSPLSLFANILVSPVITLAMWTGVLASAAAPFGLDGPLFALMGKLVGVMLSISDWLSARSPVDAVGAIPAASVVLLTIALIIGALATTWLRWFALAPLALGLLLVFDRTLPEILIAEDGRLVAWANNGEIAVNRSRPNGFTMTDWRRATAAAEVVKPLAGDPLANRDTDPKVQFVCQGDVCVARREGFAIAHVAKAAQIHELCGTVDLIVVADPAAGKCERGEAPVITARDLARHGSATVKPAKGAIVVTYSIREPYRPWHTQRQFGRAARGLAPFVPRTRQQQPAQPKSAEP